MISAWWLLSIPVCLFLGYFINDLVTAWRCVSTYNSPDTDTVKRHLFEEVHKGMRGGL